MNRLNSRRKVPIKLPLTLSLDGGSYQNLRSSNETYPLRINLGVGKFKASINGNLTEPLAMKGEDGLNVARALGVLARGAKPIPIRCALLDLQANDRQMAGQTLAFATAKSIISGEGKIDLRDKKLNITLTPVPKDFSPFSLRHSSA